MPEFGERFFWYALTAIGVGVAALLTPQISIYQRAFGWLFAGIGVVILLRIEWSGIHVFLQQLYAKVGTPHPNTSFVIVSVVGAILGATAHGGIWWVLRSQSPANVASPFAIDLGTVTLKDPTDLRGSSAPSPTGTYTLMMVRIRNYGTEPNAARDWTLTAKTIGGDSFMARPVMVFGDLNLPMPQGPNVVTARILSPADNLVNKAIHAIPVGDSIEGYLLFWFADVPRTTLHIPGTLFTLECKDTFSDTPSQATYRWKGRNVKPDIYPGFEHSPLVPNVPADSEGNFLK